MENLSLFSKDDFINVFPISKPSYGILSRVQHKKFPDKFFFLKSYLIDQTSPKNIIQAEIEILKNLGNIENIPKSLGPFYGFYQEGFSNDKYNLIFDYFPLTLLEIIKMFTKEKRHFILKNLIQIFESFVSTFAFLQTLGVCNFDLKPSNVFYDEDKNQIYLMDFSQSKTNIIDAPEDIRQILIKTGSPLYFSPELEREFFEYPKKKKRNEIDIFKSDVFSMGVIILELGTLQTPKRDSKDFKKWKEFIENDLDLFKNIYGKEVKNNEIAKKELEFFLGILKKCLILEIEKRPDFKSLFFEMVARNDEKMRKIIIASQTEFIGRKKLKEFLLFNDYGKDESMNIKIKGKTFTETSKKTSFENLKYFLLFSQIL